MTNKLVIAQDIKPRPRAVGILPVLDLIKKHGSWLILIPLVWEQKSEEISLRVYLNIGIAIVLAVSSVVLVLDINNFARKYALLEAEEKAKIILDRNLATHTYFSRNLKPKYL